MPDRRAVNRTMFWRVIRRMVLANRARLFVILLALGAGSAVTAALLNLQVDAQRRITTEFRSFGPNVIISAPGGTGSSPTNTLPESYFKLVPPVPVNQGGKEAVLYVLAKATGFSSERPIDIVVVGVKGEGDSYGRLPAYAAVSAYVSADEPNCELGVKAAARLHIRAGDRIFLSANQRTATCYVEYISNWGESEDSQIMVNLETAQNLAGLQGLIHAIRVRVPGSPEQIRDRIAELGQKLPNAEIQPVRQFTEGEAQLYRKISGVLLATVAVVLVLTALCVMAAMTNIAAERKNDVGLMKAIGGSVRRVLRIFLAEAALLGLAAGLVGAAAGILLSIGLGKAVFGVAAQPRLVVYPVAVVLTVSVAILAAYPLRRLANIRPASVFRGEE